MENLNRNHYRSWGAKQRETNGFINYACTFHVLIWGIHMKFFQLTEWLELWKMCFKALVHMHVCCGISSGSSFFICQMHFLLLLLPVQHPCIIQEIEILSSSSHNSLKLNAENFLVFPFLPKISPTGFSK